MVQGRGGEGFLLEAAQPVGIARESLRQDLDGHLAFEARVAGAVDLAHAARAQQRDNFVRSEFRARGQVHSGQIISLVPSSE